MSVEFKNITMHLSVPLLAKAKDRFEPVEPSLATRDEEEIQRERFAYCYLCSSSDSSCARRSWRGRISSVLASNCLFNSASLTARARLFSSRP